MGATDEHKPLISIITITYNAEKELPATMKSVAMQSFKDFEHLIIDGASKDETIKTACEFGTENLIVKSEPDKGLYDAMNKGLREATGKYILFLNAGDAFHSPDTLEKYAEAAYLNPDIIYGDTVIVNEAREVLRPRHLAAPENLTFKSFSNGMLVCHQAFMVKRELAPEYDLSYRFSADYDWTVKCLSKTKSENCINLKTITIDYLEAGMTDKNKMASLKERMRIMAHHYGWPLTLFNHFKFIFRTIKRKGL